MTFTIFCEGKLKTSQQEFEVLSYKYFGYLENCKRKNSDYVFQVNYFSSENLQWNGEMEKHVAIVLPFSSF